MRPGIIVQHGRLPDRRRALIRCDITALIGFIPQDGWPEGAAVGDFIEIVLRREADLWSYPDWKVFDPASRRAVRDFFLNGGEVLHLFGVFLRSFDDLRELTDSPSLLEPLLDRLRTEEDIALLISPAAAYMPCEVDRRGVVRADAEGLYDRLLAHCREMTNRFLIIDAPNGLHDELLLRWVEGFRSRELLNRSYGAVYYPWLFDGQERFPPSASLAGVYVHTEKSRGNFGVYWPPANVPLKGVTHPEVELRWDEVEAMSDNGINPLVLQSGRGVVVFGARTLSQEKGLEFINSRRVVSMITEQLRRDSEWAVFETNNPHLWDVLDRDIRYRLEQFWRAGLLSGDKPGEQYSVLCDNTNNPRAQLDAGQVNVEVKIYPVGTTEQIVIDLQLGG
ncbi:MAG: phage tail sheath C-terminal domain-containing protein [Myxococcota bacterium]